jgi:methylphosphotriester-DNA--protein-cysteine methyltransferase
LVDSFYCASRTNGHKNRRFYVAMRGGYRACARLRMGVRMSYGKSHQRKYINCER